MKKTETTVEQLKDAIIEAIRNKKGKHIAIIDMRTLESAPCPMFIVAQGNTNTQVSAIANEIEDFVRKQTGEKVLAVVGQENAEWIAMDYADIIVHIFQPQLREFYDIEHLWGDAQIMLLPDED